MFTGRGWQNGENLDIDVKQLIENIRKRREAKRTYEERKREEKNFKRQGELIPYEDEDLNPPYLNNPGLFKLQIKDTVVLNEKPDKNEPRYQYVVEKINFPKREAFVRRDSGLDLQTPDGKWINFSLIHKIFPYNKSSLTDFGDLNCSLNEKECENMPEFYNEVIGCTNQIRTPILLQDQLLNVNPEYFEPKKPMEINLPLAIKIIY